MDKAEATGFGVALAGHVALLAVLSLGFAAANHPPMLSTPIEVSFVDEIGLQSAVTEISTEPPAQSVAPDLGAPDEAAPQPSETVAEPQPSPATPTKAAPEPKPSKRQAEKPAPAKPAPAKPAPRREERRSGSGERSSGSRLGDDFLKGIGSDPSPSKSQKPSGAVMSAQAMSSIAAAIQRQIQPCANRQRNPGPGANEITVKLNLRLNRDGSLARRPTVISTTGVDSANSRYEERVKDLAIASYVGCSPLRGLPEELYQTPKGGWSNINMTYSLP